MLVVLAVALSMVAPIAAASTATATSSGPPSGMVGVPSGNVGPPDHANGNGPGSVGGPPAHANIPTHAAAWELMADKHASTLEMEIASTAEGELVLRAIDDKNHEGRTIAVDAQTLTQAVGHRPTTAYGSHSSGSQWVDSIEYENGYAKIEISRFSTNEITFDGRVQLTGSPASDGTAYSYQLEDASNIDDYTVNLTGVKRTADTNQSVSGAVGSKSVTVGGNLDPVGPSGSEPVFTAQFDSELGYNDTDQAANATYSINTTPGGTVTNLSVRIHATMDSDASEGEGYYDVYLDGTKVMSGKKVTIGHYSTSDTETISSSVDNISIDGSTEVVVEETDSFGTGWNGGTVKWTKISGDVNDDATVSVGSNSTVLTPNDNVATLNLSPGSQTVSVESSWAVNWTLDWRERAVTEDVTIDINGNTISQTGVLNEGENETLQPDSAWLTSGENNVTVSTKDLNGYHSVVDLSYSHVAATNQSVEYQAETWSERYNASRTWDSATKDASVTIPFASSRVVAVRSVEYRVNGGSWQPLESYSMDGTTLTANFGTVSESDKIGVRANGTKVRVENGAIRVIDPTVAGNSLDTALEITNRSSSFGIAVGGTSEGQWVHKTANESWTSPDTFVTIDASGGQTIRAPGASAGSTMNVRTVPLEVTPDAGAVNLTLKESSKELTFNVEPTSQVSEVTYRYHETVSGERYVLYSETHGVARDSEIAQSPVSLLGGSYSETLSIILDSGSSSSSGTGGGGFGGLSVGPTSSANPLLVLVVGTVAIAGTAYVARRTGVPMSVVGGTGLLVAILGIETISPGTISDGVRSAIVLLSSQLGPVMPLVALILVGTGAYMAVRWWQGRTGPDTQVTLQLNGGNK